MHSGTVGRSLKSSFGTENERAVSPKLAAAPPHRAPDRLSGVQDAAPSHQQLLGYTVSTADLGRSSPASTESLPDQTLEELGLSPMGAGPSQPQQLLQPSPAHINGRYVLKIF